MTSQRVTWLGTARDNKSHRCHHQLPAATISLLRTNNWIKNIKWKYQIFNARSVEAPNCQTFKINKNELNKGKFVYLLGSCIALPYDWGGYTPYTKENFLENWMKGWKWRQYNFSQFLNLFGFTKVSKIKYIYVLTRTIPADPCSEFFLYLPTLGETERKRSSPPLHVLPGSGEKVSLVVVVKKNTTWVRLVCNLH